MLLVCMKAVHICVTAKIYLECNGNSATIRECIDIFLDLPLRHDVKLVYVLG